MTGGAPGRKNDDMPPAEPATSRTLVLLRHGKSAYPPGVNDHDRPLAPRGNREAALAGGWISANLPPVDHIVCSTATRTRQTLQATGLAAPAMLVDFADEIYQAYPDELLEIVAAASPDDRTVLLVGHAPGLPELAEQLAQKNDLLLRYTRITLIQPLKKWMEQELMYHLALESLAKLDKEDVMPDHKEIADGATKK